MTESSRSILIVDDERNVLNALRRSLRTEGYALYLASSPAEALALLAKQPIDLVISDHLMPEMTGLELLKTVRERYPETLRIMLTGHSDLETAIQAVNQGEIYRYLGKPWDEAELKITLHIAFEHLALERENRRLLSVIRKQNEALEALEQDHPGIFEIVRDARGAILLDAFNEAA